MSVLTDAPSRADLLNRLKRAEGQLRGIQRMLEEGEDCRDIATQLSAVRKALDSTCTRMTVCFVQQELRARLATTPEPEAQMAQIDDVLQGMQDLLGKLR